MITSNFWFVFCYQKEIMVKINALNLFFFFNFYIFLCLNPQNYLTTLQLSTMKIILLLLLGLTIVSTSETQEYPIEGSSNNDLVKGKFLNRLTENIPSIIGLTTLVVLVAYLIHDISEKRKLRELLQAPKQVSEKVQLPPTNSNQVYLKQLHKSHELRNHTEFPIYKIVITGGPCGGKTTGLDRIKQEMTDKGFRVFSVPEVPTLVVQAGGMILMSKFSTEEKIKFQSYLIKFQMYAEDYFTKLAEMSKSPSIVLCDRGVVDPYAYISKEEFQAIMDEEGWSWVTLRDRRYDRVIFLSSAACGAEDFYTLDNNAARSEGLEVAKYLDGKTLEGWTGHPHLSIIANVPGETFSDKMKHAVQAVEQTVGLEQVDVSHEKYLIKTPVFPKDLKVQFTEIEQGFLVNEDPMYEEDAIKKRGQNNSYTYQRKYRTKKNQNGDYVQEIRKPLTSLQYVTLKEQSLDSKFKLVTRKRLLFAYNNVSFAIDIYDNVNGEKGVHLLRFNSQALNERDMIPDFIEVIKNVKRDKNYSLVQIARKN